MLRVVASRHRECSTVVVEHDVKGWLLRLEVYAGFRGLRLRNLLGVELLGGIGAVHLFGVHGCP
jgi:hypothetical protein